MLPSDIFCLVKTAREFKGSKYLLAFFKATVRLCRNWIGSHKIISETCCHHSLKDYFIICSIVSLVSFCEDQMHVVLLKNFLLFVTINRYEIFQFLLRSLNAIVDGRSFNAIVDGRIHHVTQERKLIFTQVKHGQKLQSITQ